jgi:hypothetical protein
MLERDLTLVQQFHERWPTHSQQLSSFLRRQPLIQRRCTQLSTPYSPCERQIDAVHQSSMTMACSGQVDVTATTCVTA